MATTSPFDPDKVDPEFYSKDPKQHGTSDYGHESEGVGNNTYNSATSGMDMDPEHRNDTVEARQEHRSEGNPETPNVESLGTTQEWDVEPEAVNASDENKGRMMSDEAAAKLSEIAENPSDDALFHRADATYLEEGDDPNKGYDPHNMGYDNKDDENEKPS